jgi:hypothetical protein
MVFLNKMKKSIQLGNVKTANLILDILSYSDYYEPAIIGQGVLVNK